jgi:hypothetical protein
LLIGHVETRGERLGFLTALSHQLQILCKLGAMPALYENLVRETPGLRIVYPLGLPGGSAEPTVTHQERCGVAVVGTPIVAIKLRGVAR